MFWRNLPVHTDRSVRLEFDAKLTHLPCAEPDYVSPRNTHLLGCLSDVWFFIVECLTWWGHHWSRSGCPGQWIQPLVGVAWSAVNCFWWTGAATWIFTDHGTSTSRHVSRHFKISILRDHEFHIRTWGRISEVCCSDVLMWLTETRNVKKVWYMTLCGLVNTGCIFCFVPEHGSCHRITLRMHAFCVIELPCRGTRWKVHSVFTIISGKPAAVIVSGSSLRQLHPRSHILHIRGHGTKDLTAVF
jgi:hypothetical protein